jgi:hypothetical protein
MAGEPIKYPAVKVRLWHLADVYFGNEQCPLLGVKQTLTNRCVRRRPSRSIKLVEGGSAHSAPMNDPIARGEASAPSAC